MSIDKQMLEDNEMDGYAKIDQYNPQLVESIASQCASVLDLVGEK